MEEEGSNDSGNSPRDSPSNESTKAENLAGTMEKTLQRNPADNEKDRRLYYTKESLKTYQVIKKNIYLGRKKRPPTEDDIFVCDCVKADPSELMALMAANPQISYNCGEKCINRYMCTECERKSCPCESYCQNRRFQIHKDAKVFPRPTEGKGWGLFAGEPIKKGQFVMQYIGEVYSVNCEEAQIRIEAYSKSTCTYLMKISQNEVIDPTFKGNMARFINHSCDPNCITQKWNVLGETCVGIFAIKDIPVDGELSFDYQFDSFKTPLTKCLCGTLNCKGYLGRKPHEISMEEWEEKLEYLPCSICGQNVEDDEEKLIQCESCHEAFHIFCLDPPLKRIPKESWWCDKCKVKQEEMEKLKKSFNPLELNRKLYETVKKKIGKYHSIEMKNILMYQSSDEEEVSDGEDEKRPKYSAEYEETYRLHKRLELEAMREKYDDLYPPGFGEDEANEIRIKKKMKANAAEENQMVIESESNVKGEKTETPVKVEPSQEGSEKHIEPPRPKSKVQEFKERALAMFNEKIKEHELWSQILEIERKNGEVYGGYVDRVEIDRRSKMINSIQLDVIKKNQIVFRRIGTRLFWEHHSGRINIYKKNIETTLMGSREQLRVAELVFDVLEYIAEEIEILRGQREARIRIPSMFLRKIVGAYHNQHAVELENRYEVSIQYSREYLNDECYPLTLMTDIKVKGVKDSLIAVHRHVNHKIKKLKVRRLYCNRRDYTTLLQNLNVIRRRIYPTELRFNKTKEGALKELNHPFYYIQYKDREVALIGTEREISDAEKLLEETFKNAHSGSDEADFGCVHYLWPTTNMNQQIMQQYKAEIEKEVTGTRFVYFEPIVPRKNMTLSIFGNFKEIERAKQILKEKLESLKSTSLSLEAFQEHVKYQMLKYLFKCLHNFFITGNIADIKFWDLQSVEFEKISDMTPFRKQVLRNIFTKDINFQIYVLFVCDFSKNQFFNIMKLSNRSTVDLLRKFVQNTLNSNSHLLGRMKCESVLKHDREPSPYSRRNGGSYGTNYSSRDILLEKGSRRSHERSSRERDTSNSRESYSRHRSRHYRDDSQHERQSRSPYYSSDYYSGVQRNKDSVMQEEFKDPEDRGKYYASSSIDNKFKRESASYSDKFKSKDRVPHFNDKYICEKSQSDKIQQSDYKNYGKGSEYKSISREKSSPSKSSPSRSESYSVKRGSKSPHRKEQHEKPRESGFVDERTTNQHALTFSEGNPNKESREFQNPNKQTGREIHVNVRRNGSRSLSKERSRSKSKSPYLRRENAGKGQSRSRSRSRSENRRRNKDRNRSRERARYRSKTRSRSGSISDTRGRKFRSRSKSRSKSVNRNRYKYRDRSRSSSRERRGTIKSRFASDRPRKGRFDIQPDRNVPRKDEEIHRYQSDKNYWKQEKYNINLANTESVRGAGMLPSSSFDTQTPLRYSDLQQKQEQGRFSFGNRPTEAQDLQVQKQEQKTINNQVFQAKNEMELENLNQQSRNETNKTGERQTHKSRFSDTIEQKKSQDQGSSQNKDYYQPDYKSSESSHLSQYQQGHFFAQNQMQYSYPNQPQDQSSQRQSNFNQNQQYQSSGSQYQSQPQSQYRSQNQQYSEQDRNVSRFSNKPYPSSYDSGKNPKDRFETQDKGKSDYESNREGRYYPKQSQYDDRESRDYRNLGSRNYENDRRSNYRGEGNRRYHDNGYNQGSGNPSGRYNRGQDSYSGKKIIITKDNRSGYYSNSGNYYKDRSREGGRGDE